jgi:hypothetical protein
MLVGASGMYHVLVFYPWELRLNLKSKRKGSRQTICDCIHKKLTIGKCPISK